MVTSSTLGLALAFEAAEDDVMRRLPRAPGERLLSGFFIWRIVMVSFLMMAAALGLFMWEMQRGATLEVARTMAVNAIVVSEMFYLLNSRFIHATVLSRRGLLGNPYVLAAIAVCALLQIAFTYWAPFQTVFGTAGLSAAEWGHVLLAGVFVFVVAEIEKLIQRSRGRHRHDPRPGVARQELRGEST